MPHQHTIDLLKQSLNVAQETIEIHRSQVMSLTNEVLEHKKDINALKSLLKQKH